MDWVSKFQLSVSDLEVADVGVERFVVCGMLSRIVDDLRRANWCLLHEALSGRTGVAEREKTPPEDQSRRVLISILANQLSGAMVSSSLAYIIICMLKTQVSHKHMPLGNKWT